MKIPQTKGEVDASKEEPEDDWMFKTFSKKNKEKPRAPKKVEEVVDDEGPSIFQGNLDDLLKFD